MESSQAPVPVADVPVPAQFDQLTMGEPVVFSTESQLPYLDRLFVPIISIDHLSEDFLDLPVDNILALGDQALLGLFQQFVVRQFQPSRDRPSQLHSTHRRNQLQSFGQLQLQLMNESPMPIPPMHGSESSQMQPMRQFDSRQRVNLLSEHIDEPEVFGPLVNNLYDKLANLERRQSCEFLLYLSGHGMDPGNICLVPDAMRPHPTRPEHDLRAIDPKNWYKYPDHEAECAELYLDAFYRACSDAIGSKVVPLGFVGGEVYAHHRGFIGVLGILGLWCYAHRDWEDDTYSHLVIVADCCFAGIWGNTLVSVMKSESLEEYRALLRKYPVSIQCATNGFEASHGGVFTPLWYFLQTAQKEELDGYHRDFLLDRESVSDDDMEMQHPQYVSTSRWCPTWKCFDDPAFFAYLYGKQCQQLEDLQRGSVTEGNCSPLVRPYIEALSGEANQLRERLQQQLRKAAILARHPVQSQESLEETVRESIFTIQQSLADIRDLLFEAARRSHALRPFVLVRDPNDGRDKLTKAVVDKLRKKLCQPPHVADISPGVYVFQGGQGDMSLIVTPEQEKVILIDGASNAECFYAAWDSILRHLKRITHIFVTHHDEDHTNGIQLLLARYLAGQADSLPDLSRTIIYMNTRSDFLRRNFRHEREIETLAQKLEVPVEPFIIKGRCVTQPMQGCFRLSVLLPRKQLVDEVREKVSGQQDYTRGVTSRGGTTAANVLSINLVAVWKRDAYLFTGDAHLKDVTEAARDFLRIHRMDSFKYVDVPHHGSANSNVKNVAVADRGMAGIPAEHYLISHCGNHHNPSFQTVKDILQKENCKTLHFLYQRRMSKPSVKPNKPPPGISCQECKVGHTTTTENWHCNCVRKEEQAKISLPHTCHYWECFKFFPFVD